jgi:hypothetical protein
MLHLHSFTQSFLIGATQGSILAGMFSFGFYLGLKTKTEEYERAQKMARNAAQNPKQNT